MRRRRGYSMEQLAERADLWEKERSMDSNE
jgi:hypothetical protein